MNAVHIDGLFYFIDASSWADLDGMVSVASAMRLLAMHTTPISSYNMLLPSTRRKRDLLPDLSYSILSPSQPIGPCGPSSVAGDPHIKDGRIVLDFNIDTAHTRIITQTWRLLYWAALSLALSLLLASRDAVVHNISASELSSRL